MLEHQITDNNYDEKQKLNVLYRELTWKKQIPQIILAWGLSDTQSAGKYWEWKLIDSTFLNHVKNEAGDE